MATKSCVILQKFLVTAQRLEWSLSPGYGQGRRAEPADSAVADVRGEAGHGAG